MERQTDDRCKAPSFLVYVKQQTCQLALCGMLGGEGVCAVVGVRCVGAEAYCFSQLGGNLIAEVQLSTIDILGALHLRVQCVVVGSNWWNGSLGRIRQTFG